MPRNVAGSKKKISDNFNFSLAFFWWRNKIKMQR
jgi:hypothetical protein